MTRLIATALLSTALAVPAAASDLRDMALDYFEALPSTVPQIADNRVTPEKIELGKALFFDPRLSASD
ncbi:cytochrome C peroxidase, partial [Rhodovulum sulfidophilum]|nr:cytochrome C peroxidase [Rhodovulum sulfidophilum]